MCHVINGLRSKRQGWCKGTVTPLGMREHSGCSEAKRANASMRLQQSSQQCPVPAKDNHSLRYLTMNIWSNAAAQFGQQHINPSSHNLTSAFSAALQQLPTASGLEAQLPPPALHHCHSTTPSLLCNDVGHVCSKMRAFILHFTGLF